VQRPQKYLSEEERREARRAQTRAHVKAHRLRLRQKEAQARQEGSRGLKSEVEIKQEEKESKASPKDDGAAEFTDTERRYYDSNSNSNSSSSHALSTSSSNSSLSTPLTLSPRSTDISHHSELPEIDLTFGAGAHVVNSFISFEKQWPWREALAYESKIGHISDRMVEKALFSAGMNFVADTYNNHQLRVMALDCQSYALKGMQRWMKMASLPLLAPLVATAHCGLLGNEITESYRSGDGCSSVLIQIEGGLEILRSVGPKSFLSPFGLAVFRALQRRITIMGFRQRVPVIDEHRWYSVMFKDNIMVREDKLFSLITRIPRIMQYTDAVKDRMNIAQYRPEAEQQMLELLAESHLVQRGLLSWMSAEAPGEYRGGDVIIETSSNVLELPSDVADLMPTSYKFETADDLFIMMTYWQYFIHLLVLIHEQQELLWQCQNSMSNTRAIFHMSSDIMDQLHTYITHICHSIEPVLNEALAAAWEKVMCSSCAPLRLVIQILGQHAQLARVLPNEYKWCIAVAHAQRQTENIQHILREFTADALFGTFVFPIEVTAPRPFPALLLSE